MDEKKTTDISTEHMDVAALVVIWYAFNGSDFNCKEFNLKDVFFRMYVDKIVRFTII